MYSIPVYSIYKKKKKKKKTCREYLFGVGRMQHKDRILYRGVSSSDRADQSSMHCSPLSPHFLPLLSGVDPHNSNCTPGVVSAPRR